jgi:hypothetical protein
MKTMNSAIHAITPVMLNSWYSFRIWKPTPFVPPKTSVSASTFQATAKDMRTAAKT